MVSSYIFFIVIFLSILLVWGYLLFKTQFSQLKRFDYIDMFIIPMLGALVISRIVYVFAHWDYYSQIAWHALPYIRNGNSFSMVYGMPYVILYIWEGIDIPSFLIFIVIAGYQFAIKQRRLQYLLVIRLLLFWLLLILSVLIIYTVITHWQALSWFLVILASLTILLWISLIMVLYLYKLPKWFEMYLYINAFILMLLYNIAIVVISWIDNLNIILLILEISVYAWLGKKIIHHWSRVSNY